MRKFFITAIFVLNLAPAAISGPSDGLTLATWNIQTLATAGRKVFDSSAERTPQDYDDLRVVGQSLKADVYALQEISSPAAAALVFPPTEFIVCMSGQWQADERKLGPIYDFDAMETQGIKPKCYEDISEALPDTAITPGLAAGKPDPLLGQYTALAVRRGSGVQIEEIRDLARLGVAQNDRGDAPGTFVIRKVRWGLEATLSKGGNRSRLLVVHMKSGCFNGYLTKKWWDAAKDTWQVESKRDHPCEVYARQLPALRAWIAARKAAGDDFVIAGDFNRRLDLELLDSSGPNLWPILTGSETPDTSDDIALSHIPRGENIETGKACWTGRPPEENVAIDFFVLSPGIEPSDWQGRVRKVRFTETLRPDGTLVSAADRDPKKEANRLSDHCPRVLRF